MHGEPALPPGFDHPRYANPAAPKGGRLTQGVLGTFDSLNPFIVKGLALSQIRGYVVESLLARGYDEPFTLYGLLARTVETDADRTYVTFALDPAAKFSDGKPVTADDVIFSWQLLRDKGRPNYPHLLRQGRQGRGAVGARRALRSDRRQRSRAAADPRPDAGAGQARHQSRHVRGHHASSRSSAAAPMWSARSTPAAASRSSAIRTIGAATSPINRGLWNFDEVRFDFYRDANSHLEAFKKGLYDVRAETDPGRWETAYDVPAVRDGRIVKEAFPNGLPKHFSGLVFNTRRPIFADIRVREAIGLLLDFEWLNHNFFYDRYKRSASYFEGSELSARGRPADARERALLAPFPDAVRADVMDGHLAAAGHRRLRPRPQHAEARARAARRRRLRARRHGAALARDAAAAHLRDPGHHQGPGAAGACLLRAISSAPASRRACAWSMPCNTTGGDSPTITT